MEENKSSIEYFFLAGNAVIEGFCCFVGHAEVTQYFRLFFFSFHGQFEYFVPNMPAVPMQDRGDLEDRCKEVSPRETPGSLT